VFIKDNGQRNAYLGLLTEGSNCFRSMTMPYLFHISCSQISFRFRWRTFLSCVNSKVYCILLSRLEQLTSANVGFAEAKDSLISKTILFVPSVTKSCNVTRSSIATKEEQGTKRHASQWPSESRLEQSTGANQKAPKSRNKVGRAGKNKTIVSSQLPERTSQSKTNQSMI
jgi:hypothetical protein